VFPDAHFASVQLFVKEQWAQASNPYLELAEVFLDDWNYQFRAGFCSAMETVQEVKPVSLFLSFFLSFFW